jgi:hypothetical protein
MTGRKPRLTVSVISRDGAARLPRLLAEVSSFADEIVVGVDAASTDDTFAVASAHADVVYRFSHPGQLAGARMLVFDYASGDWILSLDDDESIEESFDAILPELVGNDCITHVCLSRKWIVNLDPLEYVHAIPWFPDWQLRLFRNDRRLVWKPAKIHTGYRVLGLGTFESRASILHFEPVFLTPAERERKIDQYRKVGMKAANEKHYESAPVVARRPASRRPPRPAPPRPPARVDPDIHQLAVVTWPPLRSAIVSVDMPRTAQPGEMVLFEVVARNTGAVAWMPQAESVPLLALGNHLLDAGGNVVNWDWTRVGMPCFVPPGGEARFIGASRAPDAPGDYLVEWDLVSEDEAWFAQCGGSVLRNPLRVVPERKSWWARRR